MNDIDYPGRSPGMRREYRVGREYRQLDRWGMLEDEYDVVRSLGLRAEGDTIDPPRRCAGGPRTLEGNVIGDAWDEVEPLISKAQEYVIAQRKRLCEAQDRRAAAKAEQEATRKAEEQRLAIERAQEAARLREAEAAKYNCPYCGRRRAGYMLAHVARVHREHLEEYINDHA